MRRPRFTVEEVSNIKWLLATGMSQRAIAYRYGVSQSVISKIALGTYVPAAK